MSLKTFTIIGKVLKFLGHILKGVFTIFFHEKKDDNPITGGTEDDQSK